MIYKGWKAFDVDRENLVKYCKISVIKFLKTGEISILVCRDDRITIYEMLEERCICYARYTRG